MLTVPQAARRVGRTEETVRRWIRAGRLRSTRVGTQHLIDEDDLHRLIDGGEPVPIPEAWTRFSDGTPQPDWEGIIRRSRDGH
jgi:excisionase family DNA binding protein